MAKVLLVEKGQVSKEMVNKLLEQDFVLIEVKDLNKVKMLSGIDFEDVDVMFMAAMKTLSETTDRDTKTKFGEHLSRMMLNKVSSKE
jgi:hypothetical protein